MSEPFIAEVRIWAINFAPRGWAFCNGQLLPIAQNTALFSLVGTTYGGDGRTTLGLPNLQDNRVAIHAGGGPGLTPRRLGERGGVTDVTLSQAQLPSHSHPPIKADGANASDASPAGNYIAGGNAHFQTAPNTALHPGSLTAQGGGGSHPNVQPYQALNYCIALVGLYPSRS